MSWKPEVKVMGDGWRGNAMAFATEREAAAWAKGLRDRWIAVDDYRAVESDETVNYEVHVVDGVVTAKEVK